MVTVIGISCFAKIDMFKSAVDIPTLYYHAKTAEYLLIGITNLVLLIIGILCLPLEFKIDIFNY